MENNKFAMDINPFNITKAVDYTDEDINRYWVDLDTKKGFIDFLKPDSPMPLFLLGGKGSGKTHIMRYFSFNLQKIRYKDTFKERISKDKYLGIFLRCGGLNSSRFNGNYLTPEAWKTIFSYYIELWFSQLLIDNLLDCIDLCDLPLRDIENLVFEHIKELFDDVEAISEIKTFADLRMFLNIQQKKVDFEVNNSSITASVPKIKILTSPGTLLFGLPRLVTEHCDFFKKFKFIFLIDEFENFDFYQQKYLNTLIRERLNPVTFRVGARWFGIKTYGTFSGEEELIEGSEYEIKIIDKWLREDEDKYIDFSKKIIDIRLKRAGFYDIIERHSDIGDWFENFNIELFLTELSKRNDIPHFVKLAEKLRKEHQTESQITEIFQNLSSNNKFLERTNVFLFYRYWKKKGPSVATSNEVKLEYEKYLTDKTGDLKKIIDKYKSDIIDQLHREYGLNSFPYYGLEKLIKMSAGIPRHLLIMLKHIYRWSTFNGEEPSGGNVISRKSQIRGIQDATNWFIENARGNGEKGKNMDESISKIGQLLQVCRFSDLPPECSLSTFVIKQSFITDSVRNILKFLEQYSYVIKIEDPSREKNKDLKTEDYQINGLLAPKWELSLFRRGRLHLEEEEVRVIFSNNIETNFSQLLKQREARYNTPFNIHSTGNLTLF